MNITSAAGIISLLEEKNVEVKSFALKKINTIVDEFWPEISEVIEKIEILHEDKSFEDHDLAALVANKLIQEKEKSELMAYQIAFDLYESATQQFLERVLNTLRGSAPLKYFSDEKKKDTTEKMETDEDTSEKSESKPTDSLTLDDLTDNQKEHQRCIDQLYNILSGKVTLELHLQFLVRSNHADLLILKQAKEASRVNICHTATVISNAYMHSGTTSDQFLRDNLDWLTRATNWAKFTAVASLGVIHRGHEQEALSLLQSYLPKEIGPNTGYSEGGALYALGLIHANHGANISDYLLSQLKEAKNEIIRHGCCLGLGLATMGTNRQDVYEQLKFNLYQDDAVTGEAAGIGMGLVMLGSKNQSAIEDMVSYAQESQHEKILRGLAVGISFTMYGRLEEADQLINQLLDSKNPLFRRAGAYTIAMAYCGTGQNKAIRKLLHISVSDVNDDVRRAAVTALGFLLFSTPEQCPSVVSLLAESYNPHVRYGAAMALGIACAGTGLREAIAILEPMIKFDSVNFVRQGALIASAMIMIQQNEQSCPKVALFRRYYSEVVSNKHEDVMAKYGAILAQGIIDAGGRNVTLTLQSRTGHTNMLAVVGTHIFTQYWYWFPLTHCLSLAYSPSCVIALNGQLKMPKLELKSNCKPSLYAYPPPLEEKKREEREKISTVVLSSVARQRKREGEKKQQNKEEKMEASDEKKKDEKEAKKKEPEPNFEMLNNPARVVREQLKFVSIIEGDQYVPLKDVSIGGIVIVRNLKPGEEELVESVSVMGPKVAEENEPEPPEPFEWLED
ncbi:HEAT domain-containing protein [Oryctes borbonicus]|uniref:26S proteasome non-ATPase regulatory subunit 1 n=1 Tax=Oryctes borbonicus TaxID=1629725 RepID=A0A0T6B563_9SCAR|nr:HEAT domain-containing protein [Oryctes borbonicus]